MTARAPSVRNLTALCAVAVCFGISGCSATTVASPEAHPPTPSTAPSSAALWSGIDRAPGPFSGEVVPPGATATLVDDSDGQGQTVTASVTRFFDVPAPTGLSSPFGDAPSTLPEPGWRWVAVQLTITNQGPDVLGSADEYMPMVDVFVNGHSYQDLVGVTGRYAADGCQDLAFPPLAPHASASGCIALQVPAGSHVESIGLGLHAAGVGVSPRSLTGALATWRRASG